eukprot:Em0628g4a
MVSQCTYRLAISPAISDKLFLPLLRVLGLSYLIQELSRLVTFTNSTPIHLSTPQTCSNGEHFSEISTDCHLFVELRRLGQIGLPCDHRVRILCSGIKISRLQISSSRRTLITAITREVLLHQTGAQNIQFSKYPTAGDEGNSDDDGDSKPSSRKRRNPVPDEKKDTRYWEKRKKNNMAAKKSRESKRKKLDDEIKVARDAIHENQKLKQEIEVLKAEINSLRRLLKDANMTLSLWIRARQASEPNTQLPPMLRSPNISFVNFPVSSTV